MQTYLYVYDSLAPRRFESNFRVIFKLNLVIDGWGISCGIALTWTPQVLNYEKSILVQVMACSGWNCQPWPSGSQNWMFVYFIIILSCSQQFPTSSSQNQVELGEWATGHFMHWLGAIRQQVITKYLSQCWPIFLSPYGITRPLKHVIIFFPFRYYVSMDTGKFVYSRTWHYTRHWYQYKLHQIKFIQPIGPRVCWEIE